MIVRAMKHSVKRVFPEIERTKKQRDIITALRIHVGVNMKRSGYNLFKILALIEFMSRIHRSPQ